jgi:hypothetical protein
MTRKYRILNTEPGHFFAQYRFLLSWEVLKPFDVYAGFFRSEVDARNRIEVDIHQSEHAAAIRVTRKALLRGYPKVIAYVRKSVT